MPDFFLKRGLRIFPGLLVAVLFVVGVVGQIFTSLSVVEYFSSTSTWSYIWKAMLMLGSPPLPGLFETNPYPISTNGSLWTLRYEVLMYVLLAVIGKGVPAARLKLVCTLMFVFLGLGWLVLTHGGFGVVKVPFVWRFHTEFFVDRIFYLGAFFFAGAVLYLWFEKVPRSGLLAVFILFLAALVNVPVIAMMILWFALPYAAVVFAYESPKAFHLINGIDYSYGIYIYAFPLQQAVSLLGVQNGWSFITVLSISLVSTVVVASGSWHFVERPMLALKYRITKTSQASDAVIPVPLGRK